MKNLAACLMLLTGSLLAAPLRAGQTVPDLTITDQYDQQFRLSAHLAKPVLLISGDRLGSDYMGVWARAVLHSPAADQVEVVRVANLHAVPDMFHNYVKGKFRSNNSEGKPGAPVLLDWDGELAKLFGFVDDLTNVYLIDTQETLCYQASGKGTQEEIDKLLLAINDLGNTTKPTEKEQNQ